MVRDVSATVKAHQGPGRARCELSKDNGTGTQFTDTIGAATAFSDFVAVTPGSISSLVAGTASAPPSSFSIAFATARTTASILNQNSESVMFPLLFTFDWTVHAASTKQPSRQCRTHSCWM